MWKQLINRNVIDLKIKISQAIKIIDITILLQSIYRNRRDKDIKDIWGSYRPKRTTRTSQIKHTQKRVTQKEAEAITEVVSRGRLNTESVEQSLHSKCKIIKCIYDIFNPEEEQKVILIEGACGIGKTVLSREIAFEWANQNLLHKTLLLFLIHLRDPEIPHFTSLHEFITYAIGACSSNKQVELITKYIDDTAGKYCTIVLDGYDEISEETKKHSFISQIIGGPEHMHRILPLCSLVITSRPLASAELRGCVDHRIEILGFTEKDRDEFIVKNLENEKTIKKLQRYLKENQFINDLCYIPLNMSILLRLFEDYDNQELQTYTDMYNKFINVTISPFISKQKWKHCKSMIMLPDDLEEPYKLQFRVLCKLAFDLLSSEKIVINDEDIQKSSRDFNKNHKDWNTLGLLREVSHNSLPSKRSYSYLHLSMQECLAAHYIASSKDAEENFLRRNFWDSRYLNTGVMYVGLTKGESSAFKKFIRGHSSVFSRLFSAEKASIHDKVKKLHILNCLLEARNDELSELFSNDMTADTIDLSDHELEQKDIHTLNFFLSRTAKKRWEKLDLSNCFVNEEYLKNFLTISKCNVTNVSFNIINLSGNNLSQSVEIIIDLINYFKIKILVIDDNTAENIAFKLSLFSSITKVKGRELAISSSGNACHIFINYNHNYSDLNYFNQLAFKEQIYFWNSHVLLTLTELNLIAKCNAINAYEEKLTNDKIDDKVRVICEDSLTYVLHSTNTYVLISSKKLIAHKAKELQILEALQLTDCFKVNALGNVLSNSLHNWELIDLSSCNIKDECFNLSEYLTANKNEDYIKVLNLSYNSLTSNAVVAILEIFRYHVIEALIISGNNISFDEFNDMFYKHLLAKKQFLNFKNKIPLVVHQGMNDHSAYESCSVYYALETSDMVGFQTQTYPDESLCNLNRVCTDHKYCNFKVFFFSFSTISPTTVNTIEVMNESIVIMIMKLIKLRHDKIFLFREVQLDYFTCESCKILFNFIFNDKISPNCIEELDLSSHKFSLAWVPILIGSFQYCVIQTLVLSNSRALDIISETILKDSNAGKKIHNFIEKIPLTVIIKTDTEEKDDSKFNVNANTYLKDHQITTEFIQHLIIDYQATSSHTFILLDCLTRNSLNSILSVLNVAPFIKICIFETRLSLMPSADLQIHGNKIQYVLAAGIKFVAYYAPEFLIIQALNAKLIICDMDITQCCISKDGLQAIASCLIGKFKVLRNIKITKCKIKDYDFNDFCEKLYSTLKDLNISIYIETLDLSHNELASPCVNSIVKLLQCSVIEKLILSNNSINNIALTDAIFKLACSKGDKIQNINLSTPLVIINTQIQLDNSSNDVGKSAGMLFINYEIDKKCNDLILEYSSQVKKIYFMDSIATSDLKMTLKMLQNTLPDITKVVFYERYLKDEVAQKAEANLIKEVFFDISFILASDTKLLSNNSSYHHVAPLLDSNSYISTLQLTKFVMKFPSNGQFIRTLIITPRTWEMFDLSGSNIRDDGCLELQKHLIVSKCTIKDLYNNLSFASAAAIANIILHCSVKKVDISNNKVQDSQVNDALRCLKQNSKKPVCVEVITNNSAMVIVSNASQRYLPSIQKAKLSIMHYNKFEDIYSSFNKVKVSQVIFQNNGLTLEQITKIIKIFPFTDLHIEEPYMHYTSNFIDYSMQYLNSSLEKIAKENNNISSLSSLIYSEVNIRKNKICLYNIKTLNSVEDILTNFIPISAQLSTIKLLNCYVTHNVAEKFAAAIKKSTDLRLLELHYNHIQESDLKIIINSLKSTKSLNVFVIKSINYFSEDIAGGIADIIAGNRSIKYLEISNCNIKQPLITKIAGLWLLKYLSLN